MSTRIDHSGDYPVIVNDPDVGYFARPTEPDEGYEPEFPWVVIDEKTGEHLVEGTEEVAHSWVATFSRHAEG
jgi:hypothetical protein